ncbi:MAG: BACON domain-containing protein, partial [Bacteroidales bacterium]|nr:BACON domain-containing protein [Bacteroidales bacterium]
MKTYFKLTVLKLIITSFLVFVYSTIGSLGQETLRLYADAYDENTGYWSTGYVNSNYQREPGDIYVGKPTIGYARRGFIYFQIPDDFPRNAIIHSIQLRVFPYNPAGSNHNLEIHDMNTINIGHIHGDLVWPDCGDGTIYYDGPALAGIEDEWVSITLNSSAISDFLDYSISIYNIFNLGLTETDDNSNTPHIHGYSNSTYRPQLVVTYTVPCTVSVPTSANISSSAGSRIIPVTSNGASSWSASESCSWVTISPASGTGSGTVTATYQENTSINPRSCTITFSCGSSTDTYTLNQAGASCTVLVPTGTTVSSAPGTTSISVTSNGASSWSAS